MSPGEVGALRLSDVDWKRGTIDISHALKYTPQTGSFEGPPKSEAGERIIALPVGMMAVLDQTRAYQEDCKRAAPHLWVAKAGLSTHGTARNCIMTRPADGFATLRMRTALKVYAFTTCGTRTPARCLPTASTR